MAKSKKKSATATSDKPKAKSDAYTGMLLISLLALVGGCVLIFLDFQKYDYGKKPPAVSKVTPVTPDAPPDAGNPPGP